MDLSAEDPVAMGLRDHKQWKKGDSEGRDTTKKILCMILLALATSNCKRIFPPSREVQGSPHIPTVVLKHPYVGESWGGYSTLSDSPASNSREPVRGDPAPIYGALRAPDWLLKSLMHIFKLVKLCKAAIQSRDEADIQRKAQKWKLNLCTMPIIHHLPPCPTSSNADNKDGQSENHAIKVL
jgi:hypothetical protein